ncbi:uncharacterized protein [Panulirus ornatus]
MADTRGFRAFGDLIPNLPEPPTAPLTVGVPVVVGIPLIRRQEMLPVDVPTLPPRQGTLERGIPAPEVGHTLPEKGTGSNPEQEITFAEPDATHSAPGEASLPTQEVVSKSIIDGRQIHDMQFSQELVGHVDETEKGKSIVSITAAPHTATPQTVPPSPAPPVFAHQHAVPDFTIDQSKNLVPQEASPQQGEDDALLQQPSGPSSHLAKPAPIMAKSTPMMASEKNFVMQMFDKLTTVFDSPAGTLQNSQTVRNSQDSEKVFTGTLESSQAEPIKVSNFVLIDRLRVPTVPKPRVGSMQLVPQPVKVKGKSPAVIMGLHTSGRPPINRRNSQIGRSLAPLGIHLLNLVPFQGSRKSVNANGPVPRPIRIVGEPNLENFYRPAQLALTTPSPFRLPRPMRDYDHDYEDFEYLDYGDYEIGSIGGSGGPRHKTKSKTVRASSDENSWETDSIDSEENDD